MSQTIENEVLGVLTRRPQGTEASAVRTRPLTGGAGGAVPPDEAIAAARRCIAPAWPLRDFVAVNPFLGHTDEKFLDARARIRRTRNAETLPAWEYFADRFRAGAFEEEDVAEALAECRSSRCDLPRELAPDDLLARLRRDGPARKSGARTSRPHTVAEAVDEETGSRWGDAVVDEISRHCAAHFDEGQATWSSPWRDRPLFEAWRQRAALDLRIELLGLRTFRRLVGALDQGPREAVSQLLARLGTPHACRAEFLECQIRSIAGWAAFVRRRSGADPKREDLDDDLTGLLAIRLAYDVALAERFPHAAASLHAPPDLREARIAAEERQDAAMRYVLLEASEAAFRRRLLRSLAERSEVAAPHAGRRSVQMVFCIDVRSEPMRRQLESTGEDLQTFGFAGFFGLPLEHVPAGAERGTAQCPVLLQPSVRVRDVQGGGDVAQRLRVRRAVRKTWSAFRTSASSCFSFVESTGLSYGPKLVANALGFLRRGSSGSSGASGSCPSRPDAQGIPLERRIELAAGLLTNLGLTSEFARIVVFCGHASRSANNAHAASLDCGACGGHSGEPNARVAAAILRDPAVREGLRVRGLDVPDDTWFVAAVHETTTDEIRFVDAEDVPLSHAREFDDLRRRSLSASRRARAERTAAMGCRPGDASRRSGDWSEVRPEWGLAGNAALIAAPRARTRGLDLAGRVFLHDYDAAKDPRRQVLETILTAPVVVANWINLQYFASSIDNRAWGCGDKTLHDVVGGVGVLEGNGGDLRTGLPWQSVHDGRFLRHEPLRLLVVVEASRDDVDAILARHASVRSLVENGWLALVAWERGTFHRRAGRGRWLPHVPAPDRPEAVR